MRAMHLLRPEQQVGEWQREQPVDRVHGPALCLGPLGQGRWVGGGRTGSWIHALGFMRSDDGRFRRAEENCSDANAAEVSGTGNPMSNFTAGLFDKFRRSGQTGRTGIYQLSDNYACQNFGMRLGNGAGDRHR